MVKGVSRQVIMVRSPDKKLFEQAIFILRDDAPEVTDEALLKEAKALLRNASGPAAHTRGPLWAMGGAMATGLLWMLSMIL